MAAIGVLISGYLAWVPQDPADRPLIAAVALVILAATGTVAGALLRPRSADSRVCRATVRDRTTSDSGRSRRAVR